MSVRISAENYSQEAVKEDRKIITSASVFGILRQQLAKNIGIKRIKGFLFHYGWEMGVNVGKEALEAETSLEYLIKHGPIIHIQNGHISGIKHDCTYELDENKKIKNFYSYGTWYDSYEADEHLKRVGKSSDPVCHTLIGFASGFMSTIFGETLLAKETTCVGKGDSECCWVIKPKKEWEQELQEENALDFYNETPIVKELELTYDQLLDQKNVVTRLAHFQNQLTEEIINGSDLQTIADMVYETVRIPMIVEDAVHSTITYSGLEQEQHLLLKTDMENYLQKTQFHTNPLLPFRKKIIKTSIQERLITPILLQKEVIGYCSFLYEDINNHYHEEDYLFLDRFANAASLILLNEKTKFETFERMKGSFLEQILEGRLPASEIIKRGKYTGENLEKNYYIAVMEYRKSQGSIEDDFLLEEQIFESTFRYFKNKKQNILAGHRDGSMVLLITTETIQNKTIDEVMHQYFNYMNQKFPQGHFKLGISRRGEDIGQASRCYEEAAIAIRLAVKKKIVPFQSLGIVGVLINSKNISGIKMIAEQELGPLYRFEDPKMLELLKTLYSFLLNGGKLEQTMQDLTLSMSGLRHRISRIESLLEKDIRDPDEMHQLLLIIKSLIAIGEITFD
ncbi:V4R domain-containing protein [Neobacillus citreus]|uniref:Helix-turn-helix domain-containing protein n=1 Tax=Neobacillus citreus TaxID=2833578 RepID=A0A942YC70_9BACI|nr:V4R domain-containing protein [Neobacillus citreus]MCH6269203.1 helix-turn-helix domain-containing protein [Neobacillus citreus]